MSSKVGKSKILRTTEFLIRAEITIFVSRIIVIYERAYFDIF